jgi:ATP-dependent helicase/nuclease subunit B
VLTSSARLSRHLLREVTEARIANGLRVWPTPDILPLDAWFCRMRNERLYSRGPGNAVPVECILTQEQEHELWIESIRRSAGADASVPAEEAAGFAQDAHRTLVRWNVPFDEAACGGKYDAFAFLRWRTEFIRACDREGFIDSARADSRLLDTMAEERSMLPRTVLHAGFDIPRPELEILRAAFNAAGARFERLETQGFQPEISLTTYSSIEEEMDAAACWARGLIDSGSGERIAVVAPDLSEIREALDRIFTDILDPAAVTTADVNRGRLFDISLGPALSSDPPAAAALRLLELLADEFPCHEVGSMLRSPWIAGAEAAERALLDARLRRKAGLVQTTRDIVETHRFRDETTGEYIRIAPDFVSRLERMRTPPARQTPSAWARTFRQQLELFGWPGDRRARGNEYKSVADWNELLDTFASLDPVAAQMDLRGALRALRRLASKKIAQRQAAGTGLQIVGLFEAAGMEFDHVRLIGMSADAWPRAARYNPFLPYRLQERYDIPFCTPESAFRLSRMLLESLISRTRHTVRVSRAARKDDVELAASPLCRMFPERPAESLSYGTHAELLREAGRMNAGMEPLLLDLQDEMAPPVASPEIFPGGTRIFESQSVCPFRAYAEARLRSKPLEEPEHGLPAKLRGTFAHEALCELWKTLASHDRLTSLPREGVESAVREAVSRALAPFADDERFAGYLAAESTRLLRLLPAWLEIEKQRAPFTVLRDQLERSHRHSFGNITFEFRVDRMDELEDGGRVLIDYKTGAAETRAWLDERIEGVQLPLYALSLPERVAAVAYAKLAPDRLGFGGVAVTEGILPRVASSIRKGRSATRDEGMDWTKLLAHWETQIGKLCDEFSSGVANVSPKNGLDTCEYCGQMPLCRIHDAPPSTAGEPDTPGEE